MSTSIEATAPRRGASVLVPVRSGDDLLPCLRLASSPPPGAKTIVVIGPDIPLPDGAPEPPVTADGRPTIIVRSVPGRPWNPVQGLAIRYAGGLPSPGCSIARRAHRDALGEWLLGVVGTTRNRV